MSLLDRKNLDPKQQIKCGYCGASLRRDRLDKPMHLKHPGKHKKEEGDSQVNFKLLLKVLERHGLGLIKDQRKKTDRSYKETQLYWFRALDNQTDSTQELLLIKVIVGWGNVLG